MIFQEKKSFNTFHWESSVFNFTQSKVCILKFTIDVVINKRSKYNFC